MVILSDGEMKMELARLMAMCSGFDDGNIWNLDESACFIAYAPEKRLIIRKNEFYRKSKAKDERLRFTLTPIVSADGDGSFLPGVIVKANKMTTWSGLESSRTFVSNGTTMVAKKFPGFVAYSNQNGWMTREIFKEELKRFSRFLAREAPIDNEDEELQRQQIEKVEEELLMARDFAQLDLGDDREQIDEQPEKAMEIAPQKKPEKPKKQASILSFFAKK
ncbi:Oidioi.mRNA.OKI2018_I69.XSR.g16924.t1.cds [Oikopleura dioica]|uniref:Oidioi.mRNA.OKI2018_I69.XSR.g16924.t1.cds n=1 Tax=Oikopleura dioica TaxID=34765 RepID=A0ABN7SHM4_OIKDI|nr:Oidioi.mRNA.OKI2018_I69.XSR.g16924.t1.cds [Oikopleura dioica]